VFVFQGALSMKLRSFSSVVCAQRTIVATRCKVDQNILLNTAGR